MRPWHDVEQYVTDEIVNGWGGAGRAHGGGALAGRGGAGGLGCPAAGAGWEGRSACLAGGRPAAPAGFGGDPAAVPLRPRVAGCPARSSSWRCLWATSDGWA